MDVDLANEAAGGPDHSPATAACLLAVIGALPGELGASRSVSGTVADIEVAADGDKGDLAMGAWSEGDVRFLDLVDYFVFPDVHLDDPPAAGESPGFLGLVGPGRFTEWLNMVPINGEPVLVALIGGAVADELMAWSDQHIVDDAVAALATMYR